MTTNVPDSLIPYDEIVQEALRAVVGRVLGTVAATQALPGGHHFYITFKTHAPGVDIPQRLIERLGGVAHVSPSMREVPVSEPTSAVDFAHRLISGQIVLQVV